MSTSVTDTPIDAVIGTDGSVLLITPDTATAHRDFASVWRAIDQLDAPELFE